MSGVAPSGRETATGTRGFEQRVRSIMKCSIHEKNMCDMY